MCKILKINEFKLINKKKSKIEKHCKIIISNLKQNLITFRSITLITLMNNNFKQYV